MKPSPTIPAGYSESPEKIIFAEMFSDEVRRKLQNIIQGTVIPEQTDTCTTIRNQLCTSFSTSTTVKKDFEGKSIIKKEQVRFLEEFASWNGYWVRDLPPDELYLTEGGEAKVYLHPDGRHVVKLNDGVYYATWLEYFNSVVIHNLLFPATAYTFLGFVAATDAFLVMMQQPYISSDATADLVAIQQLLSHNGFRNTKRQDYVNDEFGLILEDMHDENVLTKENTLFFIDTVFFIYQLSS